MSPERRVTRVCENHADVLLRKPDYDLRVPRPAHCERCGRAASYFVGVRFHGLTPAETEHRTLCLACYRETRREIGLGRDERVSRWQFRRLLLWHRLRRLARVL